MRGRGTMDVQFRGIRLQALTKFDEAFQLGAVEPTSSGHDAARRAKHGEIVERISIDEQQVRTSANLDRPKPRRPSHTLTDEPAGDTVAAASAS